MHLASSASGGPTPAPGLSLVAWVPERTLELPEWIAVGRRLGAVGRCSQWGLGDWIRYGNTKFGERYARAARITGYDPQTLMNMVYVASRFEISRRRENLSWSHHETLASLGQEEQERWLDRALSERLSIADLRTELRGLRREAKRVLLAKAFEPAGLISAEAHHCPHCGGLLPPRAHEN